MNDDIDKDNNQLDPLWDVYLESSIKENVSDEDFAEQIKDRKYKFVHFGEWFNQIYHSTIPYEDSEYSLEDIFIQYITEYSYLNISFENSILSYMILNILHKNINNSSITTHSYSIAHIDKFKNLEFLFNANINGDNTTSDKEMYRRSLEIIDFIGMQLDLDCHTDDEIRQMSLNIGYMMKCIHEIIFYFNNGSIGIYA